jgi:hypothetical protein
VGGVGDGVWVNGCPVLELSHGGCCDGGLLEKGRIKE